MKNSYKDNRNYLTTGYLIIALIIGITSNTYSQTKNKSIVIELSQNNIDGNVLSANAGDTVLLKAGMRKSIRITNFHGDSTNYITFKNFEGEVVISNDDLNYGISVSNCSYFRLTGSGDANSEYGIKIMNTLKGASGLGISNFSTNYEIDHLEIANSGFAGIFAKTDPRIDGKSNRGNFTQYDTNIHNNYIHHTAGEGIYLGHSFYTGIQKIADGDTVILYPHELKGVRVFNNILDNNGFDGIQVGCATEDCEIYNNQITNYGTGNVSWQKSGIQISGGTTGKCYNNSIIRGSGTGISVFGLGNNTIYNNIIVNAGNGDLYNDPQIIAYGIFCDDRSTIPGSSFNFINNQIISPKTDGIRIYSSISKKNKIINIVIYNPGSYGMYSSINKSYIYFNPDVELEISNNYLKSESKTIENLESLDDVIKFSYSLPIADKGKDISAYGITTDFNNNARVINNKTDIGAFELEEEFIINEEEKSTISIYPNPSNGEFMVSNSLNETMNKITIKSLNGSTVYEEQLSTIKTHTNLKKYLKAGNYIAYIHTNNSTSSFKIIIN